MNHSLSLMTAGQFMVATVNDPLSINNLLTGEVHGYATVGDALKGQAVFEFDYWPPGIYYIKNYANGTLPVLLFNKTYNVNPGSEWNFIAHAEIGPPFGFPIMGTQTRIVQSIWDAGASVWDGGTSLWDVY